MIERPHYLEKLVQREKNGLVKVITGIRRCGKSYLLFKIYKDHLLGKGVKEDHIISVILDDVKNKELRDVDRLYAYIKEKIVDRDQYYVFLDEIQFVDGFSDLVNGLNYIENVDLYVTGSNSKFLSSDILTEFRGRGDEIRVYPLSFAEYASAYDGTPYQAWKDYYTYGGMPFILSCATDELKEDYLASLIENVYIKDIVDRNNVRYKRELENILDILSSGIGSFTNPVKLSHTFKSAGQSAITDKTIKRYLDFLTDSFLVEKVDRYDIKGKKYIEALSKYYFVDVGLRNARLNYRQQEENHIMENIIFNELRIRGYRVHVGIVEVHEKNKDGKTALKKLEVDFIATKGNQKYYVQSAFEMPSQDKKDQELRPLLKINDSFKKIIVVKDDIKIKRDENGITTMGIYDFLLKSNSLDL